MRKRQALAASFAQMSPVNWQHINLQGEFDFSNETLTDALRWGQFVVLTIFCTKRSGQFLNVLFFPFPEGIPSRSEERPIVPLAIP